MQFPSVTFIAVTLLLLMFSATATLTQEAQQVLAQLPSVQARISGMQNRFTNAWNPYQNYFLGEVNNLRNTAPPDVDIIPQAKVIEGLRQIGRRSYIKGVYSLVLATEVGEEVGTTLRAAIECDVAGLENLAHVQMRNVKDLIMLLGVQLDAAAKFLHHLNGAGVRYVPGFQRTDGGAAGEDSGASVN